MRFEGRRPDSPARLDLPSPTVRLSLGILKTVTYRVSIETPAVLRLDIQGEVGKEVTGGFIGRPDVSIRNAETGLVVPLWNSETRRSQTGYTADRLQTTHLLHPGEYTLELAGAINGRSAADSFGQDRLDLRFSAKSEPLEVPDWLPLVNDWLENSGLGKIQLLVALEGPDFRFAPGQAANENVKALVLGNQKLFLFVVSHLGRGELEALEESFVESYGVTLWTRLFRKVSLLSGVPARNIIGQVPVGCGSSLFEMRIGEVHRFSQGCVSVSFAREVPAWLKENLASSVSGVTALSKGSFSEVVEGYLGDKIVTLGGSLEYLYREASYVEVIVRGVRGWVIAGNNQWEKVQISFALLGQSRLLIFVDGMLTSGLGSTTPPDSKFTYSMEPEYAQQLQTFAASLLDDFVNLEEPDDD